MSIEYKDDPVGAFSTDKNVVNGWYAVPRAFVDFDVHGNPNLVDPDDEDAEVIPDDWVFLSDDEDDAKRIMAARIHDDDFVSDAEIKRGNTVGFGQREFLVLTDDEANDKWKEHLLSYLDECMEIPADIRPYFDEEKWLEDAKVDGRGHSLSSYDGNEGEVTVTGETYYLYRTN